MTKKLKQPKTRDMRPLRQGDVMLIPVDKLPANAIKQRAKDLRIVLQYGEVTGHAHAIHLMDYPKTESYTETADTRPVDALANGTRAWLEVFLKASVTHEEHAPLVLEPGVYEIRRQREYQPKALPRLVQD